MRNQEVIYWKYPGEQGISFRNDELVEWPSRLGPQPNQSQIDVWKVEFEAVPADDATKNPRANLKKRIRALSIDPALQQILEELAG